MKNLSSPSTYRRHCLIVVTSVLLTACSGGSSTDSPPTPDRATQSTEITTPIADKPPASDTPTTAATPTDEVSAASNATQSELYYRPIEYPEMVTLPLQFITTTGGKKLGVRVSLPAYQKGVPAPGTFPVILVQTAYNLNMISLVRAPGGTLLGAPDPFMVKRGYVQVGVDTLGTGVSQGGWELLGADEQAGYGDAVDWVQQQPWSNGKIGAAGASYMAISALFSAQQRPDAIQAIFASVPMGDAMRGTVGTGGLLNGVFMSQWMTLTQKLTTQNVLTSLLNPRFMTQITQATQEHVDQIDYYYLPLIENALNGAPEITYDSEFWRIRSPLENIDRVKAPTFIFGALHDIFQRDEPILYERLRKNNVDSRLVIYNGNHVTNFMQAFIGNDQVPMIEYLLLQWFDKHLKELDTGTENIPAVVQHVKNYPTKSTPMEYRNDSYITATDWPHPLATAERWYLRGDMRLTRTPPNEEEDTHTMTNPEHPQVDAGKSENGGFLKFDVTLNDGTECSPSYDQWTLGMSGLAKPRNCYRNNAVLESTALNYETDAMDEDYYINGPLQADLWVESTVTEAVVSVRIDEVSKNGSQVTPITNGQLLASGRAVDETRSRFLQGEMIQPFHYFTEATSAPLVPGEVVKMQVEIFPTSAVIRKGNRLRVSISPSNQAQGMLNYPRQAMAEGGITTIHNSPQYPSSVVLPIVPTSAMN